MLQALLDAEKAEYPAGHAVAVHDPTGDRPE
jgi:hypothetical protein